MLGVLCQRNRGHGVGVAHWSGKILILEEEGGSCHCKRDPGWVAH